MKKKPIKKLNKKPSNIKDQANKLIAKKLKNRFSGLKFKNLGDSMMEISIK